MAFMRRLIDDSRVVDEFETAVSEDRDDRLARWAGLRRTLKLTFSWLDDELEAAWQAWIFATHPEHPLVQILDAIVKSNVRMQLWRRAILETSGPIAAGADREPREGVVPPGRWESLVSESPDRDGAAERVAAKSVAGHWYDPVVEHAIALASEGTLGAAPLVAPPVRYPGTSAMMAERRTAEWAELQAAVDREYTEPGDPVAGPKRRVLIEDDVAIAFDVGVMGRSVGDIARERYTAVARDNRPTIRAAVKRAHALLSMG